jgi:NAD-dependent dihydropyrimidine dehydrogenase PreA subunit
MAKKKFGPITIDMEKCTGCGTCATECPMEVYDKPKNDKAVPARVDDCTKCQTCVGACPENAIEVEEE